MKLEPNILVHSDALELMERLPDQKVDLIYLDPPWKTESSFLINESQEEYYDFIYKILFQSSRILKDTGNLFLYSNPELNTDFHNLLREVFGSKNHITDFIIPKRIYQSNFSKSHDTILFYRKSEKQLFNNRIIKVPDKNISKLFPYKDAKGQYRSVSLLTSSNGSRFNLNYKWQGFLPPEGQQWKYSIEKMKELYNEGSIYMRLGKPPFALKNYLKEEDKFISIETVWNDLDPLSHNYKYPGSQSVEILKRILQIGSNEKNIVLDPFCGSGSMIIASLEMGRDVMACDTNDTAIDITCNRLSNLNLKVSKFLQKQIIELPKISHSPVKMRSTEEEITFELIKKGESNIVEFKESAVWDYRTGQRDGTLIHNVYKAIASFSNSQLGGTILIGVRNDQTLIDLEKDFKASDPKGNKDAYELFLSNKIKSIFGGSILSHHLIRFCTINNCTICKIEISPNDKPIFYCGKFYVRNNNQSSELSTEDFYNFQQAKNKQSSNT